MKTKKSKKPLKPAEEYFCVLYASSEEFFGHGTNAYMKAFNLKPTQYNCARTAASRLLSKVKILDRINKLLGKHILNNSFVDKQLAFLINQNSDLAVKRQAITEYNRLKARITEKKELFGKDGGPVEVSWKK